MNSFRKQFIRLDGNDGCSYLIKPEDIISVSNTFTSSGHVSNGLVIATHKDSLFIPGMDFDRLFEIIDRHYHEKHFVNKMDKLTNEE